MGEPVGMHVDHAYHDGLDNRRRHLRVLTCRQNARNRRDGGGAGIYWREKFGWWEVRGSRRYIGTFKSREAAVEARRRHQERVAAEIETAARARAPR
jgi:hypothetical protein